MKIFIRIAVVVVLLAIVGAVAGYMLIDKIATTAVREGTAFATQTEVELESVDVKLFSSAGEIKNLDIKNPDGPFMDIAQDFDESYRDQFESFLILGNGSTEITAGSVLSDKIVIPKVELINITLTLIGNEGKKNYEVLLESLKRFQGDEPLAETKDQKQVVIKELIIRNITVYYYFDEDPALGAVAVGPDKITIADDEPLVLTDVGSGGLPISQVTADIIADVLVQVMANLAGDLGGHMKGLAGSLVDTLGEARLGETIEVLDLGGELDVIGDLGIDVGELGIDAIEGVGKGAGDLFRGATGKRDANNNGDSGSGDNEDEGKDGGSILDGVNPF